MIDNVGDAVGAERVVQGDGDLTVSLDREVDDLPF